MKYYFMKLVKEPLPWPQVRRMNILELFGGVTFGTLFLAPFVYGQYWYKTRTGLSAVNFTELTDNEQLLHTISDASSSSENTTTNFLDILKSDVKAGDQY